MSVFLTILTTLTLSWIINEIYVNILIFWYGWTDNAPRITKMYNIIGIWWTDQKLFTVKPIATLEETMKWNEMKWKKRQQGRWKIYDESHISMIWKTAEGETKDIWRKSYINEMKKKKNDSRGDERYMTKVIYQWNEKKTTAGEMKDIWRKSYVNKKRRGAQRIWLPDGLIQLKLW